MVAPAADPMANRLLRFAQLAHEVAQDAIPERAHRFAPKRYTQPQLLACLLVKEYLRLDYRTAQETLEVSDGLRDAIGLTVVPDYSTLWRFAHEKATDDVVATALVETGRRFKASGHDPPPGPPLVAIDSTGMFCGHASRYFDQRRRKGSTSTLSRARCRDNSHSSVIPPPTLILHGSGAGTATPSGIELSRATRSAASCSDRTLIATSPPKLKCCHSSRLKVSGVWIRAMAAGTCSASHTASRALLTLSTSPAGSVPGSNNHTSRTAALRPFGLTGPRGWARNTRAVTLGSSHITVRSVWVRTTSRWVSWKTRA